MQLIDKHNNVSTLFIMKAKVAKWGNSLALRLPKALVQAYEVKEGTDVELTEQADGILLKPVGQHYDLDDLLKQVHPENCHDSLKTGESNGREAW
jgi:antitoxin MazE